MNKIILFFALTMTGCMSGNRDYPYSKAQTEAFLDEISRHVQASTIDATSSLHEPSNALWLVTKYSLPEDQIKEYYENGGSVRNTDSDISDFGTWIIRDLSLTNEKGEKLMLADNGCAPYFRESVLQKNNDILYHFLVIDLELNGEYERLNGFIDIEFIMPRKQTRRVKVPVELFIYDNRKE